MKKEFDNGESLDPTEKLITYVLIKNRQYFKSCYNAFPLKTMVLFFFTGNAKLFIKCISVGIIIYVY